MDFIIDIVIEVCKLIGNLFAKFVLPKGMVEEDSILSVFLGSLIVITALMILGFTLIKFMG